MSENSIRIVPPDPSESGVTRTQGTKVYLGDVEIGPVSKIEISAVPNSIWEARVTFMLPPPDLSCFGRFFVLPAKRWWHRWAKPKPVEITDLASIVQRWGAKDPQ